MNSEEVLKKRYEELELKRKRLDEMKRSRGAVTPQEPVESPKEIPKSTFVLTTGKETSPATSIRIRKPDENFGEVEQQSKNTRLSKIKYFSYTKSPSNAINILPKEKLLYDRCTQTDEVEASPIRDNSYSTPDPLKSLPSLQRNESNRIEKLLIQKIEDQSVSNVPQTLSEFEKHSILSSVEFSEFLNVSSLRIERELDFLNQFNNVRSITLKRNQNSLLSKSIFHVSQSYDDEGVRSKAVVNVSFSNKNPNLFLTCHASKIDSVVGNKGSHVVEGNAEEFEEGDGSGLVCVWSRDFYRRPEVKLFAPSAVSIAIFGNDERDTVIGGCENGQVVVWDLHGGKTSPVQRSSMTGKGHKFPILSIHLTSSNSAFTMSIDGTICQWDISRLVEPVYVTFLGLQPNQANPSFSSAPSTDSSFLFSPQSDKNSSSALNFSAMTCINLESKLFAYVGTGTGQLIRVNLPRKANDSLVQINAHNGLITAISLCSQTLNSKLKNYFLTASLDWSVKLWNAADINKPILEFLTPLYEYICDVQWSPTNPAIFVTITSSGTLSVWNITKSVNEPAENLVLLQDNSEEANKSNKQTLVTAAVALNKAVWSFDGTNILIGDSLGAIRNVSVSANSSNNEEVKIYNLLNTTPLATDDFVSTHK